MKSLLLRFGFATTVVVVTILGTRWAGREFFAHAHALFAYLSDPASAKISQDPQLNYHLARFSGDQAYGISMVEGPECP
jgi:hypothetical protein